MNEESNRNERQQVPDGNVRPNLWKENRVAHVRFVRHPCHTPGYGFVLQMRSFLQPIVVDVKHGGRYFRAPQTLVYSFVDSAKFFLRPTARVLGV